MALLFFKCSTRFLGLRSNMFYNFRVVNICQIFQMHFFCKEIIFQVNKLKIKKIRWMNEMKSLDSHFFFSLSSTFLIPSVFWRPGKRGFWRETARHPSVLLMNYNTSKYFNYLSFLMLVIDAGCLDPSSNTVKGKKWWRSLFLPLQI